MLFTVPANQPFVFSVLEPVPVPVWAAFHSGDHVRVWRGLYWHHAIYVGNGVLVEFGSGVFGGIVAYVGWDAFAKGASVQFVQRGGWNAVERAKSLLGRGGFDALTRNCEHFANWAVAGEWRSTQADSVKAAAMTAASLTLFFMLLKKAA